MSERIDCRTVVGELVPGKRYSRPNAREVGECYDGCCADYKCPDCGITFRVELAQ